MNRHLSVAECCDFLLVVIDQDNLVPQIRKTRSRYQPHIPGTDHRDAHSEPSPWTFHLHLRLVGVQILTVAVFPALTAFPSSVPRPPSPGTGIRISQKNRDPHHCSEARPACVVTGMWDGRLARPKVA